jgi:hypothetical protein
MAEQEEAYRLDAKVIGFRRSAIAAIGELEIHHIVPTNKTNTTILP